MNPGVGNPATVVTPGEYQRALRWALLRLLDYETGRRREPTPPEIQDIIARDADLQVRGR